LNRKTNILSGFTLLELIIVLSIISLVLLFSVPVFKNIQIFSNSNNEAGRILLLVEKLKKESVQENKNMLMHIDLSEQRIWVTKEMTEDETSGFVLSQIRILDVIFSKDMKYDHDEYHNEYQIKFSSKGYSDMVLIHLRDDDENDHTIIIEPFLLKPEFEDKHVSFEDCT